MSRFGAAAAAAAAAREKKNALTENFAEKMFHINHWFCHCGNIRIQFTVSHGKPTAHNAHHPTNLYLIYRGDRPHIYFKIANYRNPLIALTIVDIQGKRCVEGTRAFWQWQYQRQRRLIFQEQCNR